MTPNPRGMPTDTRYLYEPRSTEVLPHWSYKASEARALGARKAAATRKAKQINQAMQLLMD